MLLGSGLLVQQGIIGGTYLICMVMIWYVLVRKEASWSDLGFQTGDRKFWVRTVLRSLIVFVIAMIAFILGGGISINLGLISKAADMSGYDYLRGNLGMLLLSLLAIYLTSSLGEEVIYRGFLITRLGEIFGPHPWRKAGAVFISGIVFGLVHYNWGPMGIIQTTLMGWVLGYYYIRFDRNLWVTILAHVYMDTILLVQMY